jgi:hypothetical protein
MPLDHRLNHLEYLDALASLGYDPAEPTVTTGMPTNPGDMEKDPIFQSVFSDLTLLGPGNLFRGWR